MSSKTFAVPTENTRNVTVLAHVDHGKTSFVDSLLSANNIISSRLAGKIRYLDSREDEQERGITMESSAVSLSFQMLKRSKDSSDPVASNHILNLIDTPGHVDFASEVSTASRLCDGTLVLVDVVEGVCTQTIAVLRQAWLDNLKPILVINKMDRLIVELKLTPTEAYSHLSQLIEQVNAVMGSFFASERMEDDLRWHEMREARLAERKAKEDAMDVDAIPSEDLKEDVDGEFEEKEDEDIYFAPEKGNVLFASAINGWAFRLGRFAQLYAAKLGIQENKLRRVLWGDWYLDPKTKRVLGRKKAMETGKTLKPLFVQFVLDNIWRVYETVLEEHNPEKVQKIVTALNLKINPRELRSKDTKNVLTIIFQQWLPLSTCTFQAVVDVIPSPLAAQPIRLPRMLHPTLYTTPSAGAIKPNNKLEESLYACRQDDEASVVAYVSKMFAIPRSDLPELRKKEVTAAEMRERGRIEREKRAAAAAAAPADGDEDKSVATNGTYLEAIESASIPAAEEESEAQDLEGEALIGFARIYSGTIKRGSTVQCILPKYDAKFPSDHPKNIKFITSATVTNLYMMMGRELVPVEIVPAGNIFAIGGLEGKVLRNATICAPTVQGIAEELSSSQDDHIVNLAGVVMQAAPIVRVALEPTEPADLPKLVEGLRLLNQADPCVEVLVQETGEHVILTAGELHLERCLKDLRERFAKCAITASEAIVPFRETAVRTSEMNPTKSTEGIRGRFIGTSVAGFVTVTVQSALLPETVVQFLQQNANTIQLLQAQDRDLRNEDGEKNTDAVASDLTSQLLKPADFFSKLASLLDAAGQEWKGTADKIWAFGPKRVGPNLLIDRTGAAGRGLRAKTELMVEAESQGKSTAEVAELVQELSKTFVTDGTTDSITDEKATQRLLNDFDNNVETGFQLATYRGPLCAEPVIGMAYFIEKIEVGKGEEDVDGLKSRMPQVTGSLISAVRDACRNGLLDWSPRIMLAMYSCDIQASTDVLGKVYAVVARRRGRIVSEEMKEGTSFFTIRALLPVVESFGFADEIRKRTSGAASPQLIFNGFEMLNEDPFWVPTTEEELEDFGEKADKANIAKAYADEVRKRKGMFVEQKVVEHAEKQRTLKR